MDTSTLPKIEERPGPLLKTPGPGPGGRWHARRPDPTLWRRSTMATSTFLNLKGPYGMRARTWVYLHGNRLRVPPMGKAFWRRRRRLPGPRVLFSFRKILGNHGKCAMYHLDNGNALPCRAMHKCSRSRNCGDKSSYRPTRARDGPNSPNPQGPLCDRSPVPRMEIKSS